MEMSQLEYESHVVYINENALQLIELCNDIGLGRINVWRPFGA